MSFRILREYLLLRNFGWNEQFPLSQLKLNVKLNLIYCNYAIYTILLKLYKLLLNFKKEYFILKTKFK